MESTNKNKIKDVIFNYETFLPWLQMQIVAYKKENEMCASIFLMVVIISQCLSEENIHTWFFFCCIWMFFLMMKNANITKLKKNL
jgi:hypothetical protein